MASVAKLRDRVNAALRREDFTKALGYYEALREKEPDEPRWPHRQGDLLRRLGWEMQAAASYIDAIQLYSGLGFVARAAALAKIVLQLDPDNTEALELVDPEAARQLSRQTRNHEVRAVAKAAKPLQTVEDADEDEIRFAEIDEDDILEIELSDVELGHSAPRDSLPAERLELDALAIEKTSEPAEPIAKISVLSEPPPPPPPSTEEDDTESVEISIERLSMSEIEVLGESDEYEDYDSDLVFLDHGEEPDRPSAEALAAMPAVPLFAELPKDVLRSLLLESEVVELARGEFLLQVGDPADSMHVITEGSVQVLVPGIEEPVVLSEGDVVGETSLLDHVQRRADVVARSHLQTLAIPKSVLDRLTAEHPPLDDLLLELLHRRLLSNLLTTHPLFRGLDQELRREVARLFELRRADEGTELMIEGKRPDGLYALLLGQLEARSKGVTEFLPTGTLLGQRALLGNHAALSTVTCRSECLLLRLSKSRFTEMAALYPHVLMQLSVLAAEDESTDAIAS